TLVQAGTGYGKSTALAGLAEHGLPLAWYHLAAEDADPLVFLVSLFHALAHVASELPETPLTLLEEWEPSATPELWNSAVDSLINALAKHLAGPTLLVLDDAHRLNHSAETLRLLDRFIGRAPADLHLLLATRYPLALPTLVTWRVKSEVLEIGQEDLAFTQTELEILFQERYHLQLDSEQLQSLRQRVEGWPMALPLVRQRLLSDRDVSLNDALGAITGSASDLFAYLAHEVIAQQPTDVQAFLRITAVLPELTPTICDHLRRANDSAQLLRYLHDHGLFIVDLGGGHSRYHHLFRDLLYQQLDPADARTAHLRAAAGCRARGALEEATLQLLAAEAYEEAATLLEELGRGLVRAGRLDTLSSWIGRLPPSILAEHPPLLVYLGDIARLRSRFDEALSWYQQAEGYSRAGDDRRAIGRALRGQARVYLDTVNPSQAEQLLQEALRLSDGQDDRESRARLLDLLAENMLNQGRFREAEAYQADARTLREEGPGPAELPVRLLLRSGRLAEARRVLENQVAREREAPVRRPRAHRETLLLLSLVLAFQGERQAAHTYALQGTERGRALKSPFITAVGHMRQGHAWLLGKDATSYAEARRCFQESIALSESLDVPRLKVEAFWGLTQAVGFGGDLKQARTYVRQGIAIAHEAGDEWIEANLRLMMGAALCLDTNYEGAAGWLDQAGATFRECGDAYGACLVLLWQCLRWQAQGDEARLQRDLAELLAAVNRHGYDYLFTRPTLLGPPDVRVLVPLLLQGRRQGFRAASHLLAHLGLEQLEYHPGYQLRVKTFGRFAVWRGDQPLERRDWSRQKARQLFQFLLNQRERLTEREQIIGQLWPELSPDDGQRDFKIALSAILRALEPGRTRNAPSAYVTRDGTLYGLRPEADLWIDAAEFDRLVDQGDAAFHHDAEAALDPYRQAVDLYEGEFLAEHPYAEWCSEERERLHARFLSTADRLARTLAAKSLWEETVAVCQLILAHDDCWEEAYRLLMRAQAAMGNRAQALQIYARCRQRLEAALNVEPAAATNRLYEQIRRQEPTTS
ncbi:MAG: BTAD domain-containing putative transcriptional regulator, partial [Candidatus Promineifilaceae bacterium]|nr:BTAD domain-containing putative transcriptional regulator [Candidatus Promineifilaceae bacterium]